MYLVGPVIYRKNLRGGMYMKRVISILLVITMCIGVMTGCVFSGKETEDTSAKTNPTSEASKGDNTSPTNVAGSDDGLPPMTTEEITLTYFNFDSDVLTNLLAQKFMEKYPNIKVEVAYVPAGDANTTLLNLVSAGQAPDCFMFTDCDFALSNQLLYDMTELWEADKENQNLLPTINELKIGYYDTNRSGRLYEVLPRNCVC